MERVVLLRLLLLVLTFSHLLFVCCSFALPAANPERETKDDLETSKVLPRVEDNLKFVADEAVTEEVAEGRMAMELNDYPGSGANNRHTPRPPARN